jgi:sporulation protein YlmC with PRC-barrel domain
MTMTDVFSDELIGKNAVTSGGFPLGTIEDIVIDTGTGEMKYLLVKMSIAVKPGQKTDSKGRAVISFSMLKMSGNNIIVI